MTVLDAGFGGDDSTEVYYVPDEKIKPYLCYGLRLTSAKFGNLVAIRHVRFWEMKEVD